MPRHNAPRKKEKSQVLAMGLALTREALAEMALAIKQRDKRAEIRARVRLGQVVPMLADSLANVAG